MTLAKAKAKSNERFIVQASLTIITYYHQNIFIVQATGFDFIKLFIPHLLNSFYKLDRFITMQQILLMFIKWPSLPKSV
jgi:hypothetical protein